MKYLTAVMYTAAADILSLFIAITLASSSSPAMRAVSAVCTVGILCCLLITLAAKTAHADCTAERTGAGRNRVQPVLMGVLTSLPSVISWIVLYTRAGTASAYYRIHKLINGFFLQIYNFIDSSADCSGLTAGKLGIMGVLALIPAAIFITAYFIARRRESGSAGGF